MSKISPSGGTLKALSIQRRVIGALVLRETMTRYGRHNIGFLWLFLEPMMFTIGVTILWTVMKAAHGASLPIVAFALTGYSSVLLWRNMPARCIGAIEPNSSLLYHRHVKVMDIYAARLLLEISGASASFFILSIFFISLGWMSPPEDVMKVIFAWLLIAWFGASLALFLGALSESTELVEKLWHPASYLLFPLSGAAFLVSAVPAGMRPFVTALPMVNGVELLREGYFGSAVTAYYDVPYMMMCNAALSLMGLAQMRKISREIIPQ
jgi:ABC-2 type transport system permease protein/capsular polysaccharide transport system permease protein